jgi:hypothetical protein
MNYKKILFFILASLSIAGCASVKFHEYENNEYAFFKMSDACAAGIPSVTLDFLRQEAAKFCASRKEKVIELSTSTTIGIPMIRCTDALIKFRCDEK